MVFSAPTFLFVFLPVVLLLALLAPRSWRNLVLLAASLFFYAWGEAEFVLVMLVSCMTNYTLGRFIAHKQATVRKCALTIGVIANLTLLAFFKYAAFFMVLLNSVGELFKNSLRIKYERHILQRSSCRLGPPFGRFH